MKLNAERKYYIGADGKIRRCKKNHLLALYNQRVSFAYGYCILKQCYLTSENISEKQCLMKGGPGKYCKHLYILDGVEQRRGIKKAKQKRWKGKQKNERNIKDETL